MKMGVNLKKEIGQGILSSTRAALLWRLLQQQAAQAQRCRCCGGLRGRRNTAFSGTHRLADGLAGQAARGEANGAAGSGAAGARQ